MILSVPTHTMAASKVSGIGDSNHIWHGKTLNSVGENAHLEGTYNVTAIPA